jgi:hypothetical protein
MTEFDDVIRLLREGRPQATELELDEIKQRVRRRAVRSGRSQSMKSRLAILGLLVVGMVFSTAGAGLAVSGLSGHNASIAQYASPSPGGGNQPSGGVSPGEANSPGNGAQPANQVQPARQVEAGASGGSTLPFTGFAAIPVMLGGLVLLTGGLILRRRSRLD